MAVGLSFIAAIPLALLGLVNLVDLVRQRPLEVPWLTYFAVLLVVPPSYTAAAITGGTAAYVLPPLRSHVPLWMFMLAAVGAVVGAYMWWRKRQGRPVW